MSIVENKVATNGNKLEPEFDALLKTQVQGAASVAACNQFDPDTTSAYLEQALSKRALTTYEEHLVTCAACRRHLIELSRLLPPQPNAVAKLVVDTSFKERFRAWFSGWRLGALAGLGTVATALLLVAVFVQRSKLDNASPLIAAHRSEAQATPLPELSLQDAPAEKLKREINPSPSASPAANVTWSERKETPAAPPVATGQPSSETVLNATDATFGTRPVPAPTPAPSKTEGERKEIAANQAGQASGVMTVENQRQNLRAITPSGPEANQMQAERALELKKRDDRMAQSADAVSPASPKPAAKAGAPPAERIVEKAKGKNEVADEADKKQAQAPGRSSAAIAVARPSRQGRTIGGKTFRQENGVWVDSDYQSSSNLPIIRLPRDSAEYKQTLKDIPSLKPYFELKPVIVVWQGKVYRVENK